jgi:hypothetical protein
MAGQDRATLIIERLATAQHGNVARAQLLRAGVTRATIDARVAGGRLWPRYRGVYRVGHRAPSVLADYVGGVLACGDGSLLYGLASAHLLRLIRKPPSAPHVLTPTQRRIDGVVTRRCRDIGAVGGTVVRGIPVVTVPEAIVACAAVLDEHALARVCHEAGVLHRTTPAMVERVLRRHPAAKGAAMLRAVMSGDVKVSLSRLERLFLELLREHGLPLPVTNKVAGSHRIDCRWPQQRLTVELDGWRFHNSRWSWEQGNRRAREARMRGDEFRRYSWTDVVDDPTFMLEELRSLLGLGIRG